MTNAELDRLAALVEKLLAERRELHDALYSTPTTDPETSKQQARRHWDAYHQIAR